MFVKPFRTKSNAAIRGSDRKRLRSAVQETFQNYSFDDPLTTVIPSKEEINVLKLSTQKERNVTVYYFDKNPLFFEVNKSLFPTLYFLWQHPKLVPVLTTHHPVISKLANGADLMLPGVVLPLNGGLPSFEKKAVVAVNAEGNSSALAVGIALMSSKQIINSPDRRGKAVEILHVFGDHLWQVGERLQPPKATADDDSISESDDLLKQVFQSVPYDENVKAKEEQNIEICDSASDLQLNVNQPTEELDFPQDRSEEILSVASGSASNMTQEKVEPQPVVESLTKNTEAINMNEECVEDTMNKLLHQCCLTALKTKLKDSELPILTGSFFRLKLLACCPAGKFIDIKKTKFKKLSKYLKSLEESNLLQVKELTKGNDHIVFINRTNEELKSFMPEVAPSEPSTSDDSANTETQFGVITQKQYEAPEISILYGVNSATLPLFRDLGCSKGTTMTVGEIRKSVTDYLRESELVQGKQVTINPILHDCLCIKGEVDVTAMTWEELFKRLLSKMQVYHQLKLKGAAPIVRKGSPPSVEINTQKRTGNKKVTLVKNLESFLINPQDFADKIRRVAQASTSVTVLPGSKPNQPLHQVLIQGNQVSTVENLLTGDSYKVSRKYLKGLELAPKAKGKQRR